MQTTAAEMRMLSNRFYGNKLFFATHHDAFKANYADQSKVGQLINEIYPEYYSELLSLDPNLALNFVQFMQSKLAFAYESQFSFIKTTCLVELSGFLFQKAWDKRWNREKTFEELKQILVRHSLFRPPHSVYVFTLDEVKAITYHYLTTLFRYYGAYFFVFTPWCDLEIRTREVFEKKDAKDEEVEAMRRQGEQYDEDMDPELLDQLMQGNSVHNVPAKKREELARAKAEKERQERINRILKTKLELLERDFEDRVKHQDQEFLKKIEDIKNPPKKGKGK